MIKDQKPLQNQLGGNKTETIQRRNREIPIISGSFSGRRKYESQIEIISYQIPHRKQIREKIFKREPKFRTKRIYLREL